MAAPAPAVSRGSVRQARTLSARLPELLVAARRVAASVMFGVHGRRRTGSGETFWQFRPYVMGESVKLIDWRRSARDHHLYVREREWEAAQTVWLWADLSPSMRFRSKLSETPKVERAVVLMLALAEMLGRGGERVGLPGLIAPRIGRDAADRFAAALMQAEPEAEWPTMDRVGRFAEVVVLSDCLADLDTMRERLRSLAGRAARLHLLQILDPAEETFPYEGRLEFRDPETGATWLAERAGGLRRRYAERLQAHRAELGRLSRRSGFSFSVHHTDRPAAEALLSLQARLSAPADAPAQARAS